MKPGKGLKGEIYRVDQTLRWSRLSPWLHIQAVCKLSRPVDRLVRGRWEFAVWTKTMGKLNPARRPL